MAIEILLNTVPIGDQTLHFGLAGGTAKSHIEGEVQPALQRSVGILGNPLSKPPGEFNHGLIVG